MKNAIFDEQNTCDFVTILSRIFAIKILEERRAAKIIKNSIPSLFAHIRYFHLTQTFKSRLLLIQVRCQYDRMYDV